MDILSKKLSRHKPVVQHVGKLTFQWGNFVDILISKFKYELKRVNKIMIQDDKNKNKSKSLFIMNSIH